MGNLKVRAYLKTVDLDGDEVIWAMYSNFTTRRTALTAVNLSDEALALLIDLTGDES